ncbi:4Fe-4S binding protein [Oscillospiraceae bacterium PP1C4]
MKFVNQFKKKAVIRTEECVACGSCIKVCPLSAIRIVDGIFAEVDEKLCVGCGKCKTICPACIIEIEVR